MGDMSQKIDGPAGGAFSITPDDSTDLVRTTRALYIGGSGDIVVDMAGSEQSSVTFTAVPGGILPIRVKRIRSTGTTATGIVGLY